MATFDVTITYPDNAQGRILAALKTHYGQVDDGQGGMRDRTNAEAINAFRDSCRNSLRHLVLRSEVETAKEDAARGVAEVEVG